MARRGDQQGEEGRGNRPTKDAGPSAGAVDADAPDSLAAPDMVPRSEAGTIAEGQPARPRKASDSLHHGTTHPARAHSPLSPRIAPEPASQTPSSIPSIGTVDREHYEIYGEIARGGLGRILRARDKRLDRVVAIKELHYRVGNVDARFGREMRLTARLQHPSIVPIHEAGFWPTGEPFYAMKLVEGRSLAEVASDAETLEERLGLLPNVIDVAEAIAYAHSERILHRDLKPANVLVGPFGETVVIDWGLAKDLSADDDGETDGGGLITEPRVSDPRLATTEGMEDVDDAHAFETADGAVIGTPAFMPPEQARGEAVDERADVYSLGAILYHVMSGVRPFEGVGRGELLTRVGSGRPTAVRELAPDVPRDLVAIIDKAMAHEPSARYATAAEFVDDLRSFTTGHLVGSYEYTLPELLTRFVRRQRSAVITGVLAISALLALGVWSVARIANERDQAEVAAATAQEARDLEAEARRLAEDRVDMLKLEKAMAMLDSDPTFAIAWLKELRMPLPGAASAAADAEGRGVARRSILAHSDRIWAGSFSPDGRLLATGSSDATVQVANLSTGEGRTLAVHRNRVPTVAFSPDGAHFASGSYDGRVCVFASEGSSERCADGYGGPVRDISWSPNGERLVVGSSSGIHVVRVDDLDSPERWDAPLDRHVHVRFTPDGTRIVTGSHDGALYLWPSEGGTPEILSAHAGPVTSFDVSTDGTRAVSAGEDGSVFSWDLESASGERLSMHEVEMTAVAFSPNGHQVAAAGLDGRLVLFDVESRERRALSGHTERITSVAFSPDGTLLASGGWDRTVRIWDLDGGEPQILRGHGDVVSWVGFAPDGHSLASAGWDGEVRIWPTERRADQVFEGHGVGVKAVAVSPDGRFVASGGHDNQVRLWDLTTGLGRVIGEHEDHVYRVRFSPDGRWVASSSDDQMVRLFSIDEGESHVLGGHQADVEELAFSPDGRYLASAGEDDVVFLWDLSTDMRAGRPLEGHQEPVTAVVFSPDGSLLASASRDRTVRLWDVAGGEARILAGHALEVWGVAFSPDGRSLATASLDDRVLLWDVETGDHVVLADDLPGARLVTFSADGARLGVSSSGRGAWICEVAARTCVALEGHTATVHGLVFTPDGTGLATASADGTLRLWDVMTAESRVYRGHRSAVFDVAVTPDGSTLVSGGADSTVRLWPAVLPPTPDHLAAYLETMTTATLPSGGLRPLSVR